MTCYGSESPSSLQCTNQSESPNRLVYQASNRQHIGSITNTTLGLLLSGSDRMSESVTLKHAIIYTKKENDTHIHTTYQHTYTYTRTPTHAHIQCMHIRRMQKERNKERGRKIHRYPQQVHLHSQPMRPHAVHTRTLNTHAHACTSLTYNTHMCRCAHTYNRERHMQ